MVRVFHDGRETKLRQCDRITLEMGSGLGSISRNGLPMMYQLPDQSKPQTSYRFSEKNQNQALKQAEHFLEQLDSKHLWKLVQVPFLDQLVSCFELIERRGPRVA
jgi:hypothetical protein